VEGIESGKDDKVDWLHLEIRWAWENILRSGDLAYLQNVPG